MHPLLPTLESKGKNLFGWHESPVSYKLDVTCEKTKGGTTSMWLPQVIKDLRFLPLRAEPTLNPRFVPINGQPHSLIMGGKFAFLQFPSAAYPGGPFPIQAGCQGVAGAQLTGLEVRVEGELATRGRNVLFGEKVATENKEIVVVNWTNLSVPLVQ
ncbi:hypothetical protein MMC21_007421 [Puttea exsequens]|nr:hypothetical protein [Puttea exsequens]